MISRRKFLRAGALFLPASALGQIVVPNRRVFVNPVCIGTNYTAADFEPWRGDAGCGWSGAASYPTNNGGANPNFVTRQLGNGSFNAINGNGYSYSRKLIIGNNWTQIRLGMLYQCDATANSNSFFCRFGMINSGKNWGAAGDNFIGMQFGGSWTYTSNLYMVNTANNLNAHTNVNAANAFTLLYGGASTNMDTATSNHRSLCFVELTKGSPNYTIQTYIVTAGSESNQDMNETDLNTGLGMASGGSMVISGKTLNFATTTMAFSETNGNVDTVMIYNEITLATIFKNSINSIGVRKIA